MKEGFDIFTTLNGYGAIDLLKVHKPDLILLDVIQKPFRLKDLNY